jgi:hypothetical protein
VRVRDELRGLNREDGKGMLRDILFPHITKISQCRRERVICTNRWLVEIGG